MKDCKTCGRKKHVGVCDMATLDNGHIVHASRVRSGGDLYGKVRVRNMWIKREEKEEKKKATRARRS